MRVLSPITVTSGSGVVHRMLGSTIPGYQVRIYSRWLELAPFLMPLTVRGRPADLVHTALDHACFFKRRYVPLVATAHNYVLDAAMRRFASPVQRLHYATDLRWFTRQSVSVADRIVAVSRFVAGLIKEDLRSDLHIDVIYNGVDETLFRPPRAARTAGGPYRILFCGNLSQRKRAALIPVMAQKLGPGFEILFTGGLARERRAGLERLPDNAKPLGRVAHDQMVAVYHGVDALFMPSVREGFGLCVAEAMACGLPVVADAGSAMPELVVDGDGGWLCPPDDTDCYAAAFRALAADRANAQAMGLFNRARVEERFTLRRMATEYRALFESLL